MRILKVLSVAAVLAMVAALGAAHASDGKALYDAKCAMCHGKDGVAKPMAKGSLNFNSEEFQKSMDAAAIAKTATDGKNKMPAYKGKLTDEDIQAIAEYVKTLK